MPETPDLYEEVRKIRKELEDVKQAQENDWLLNRSRYERLVEDVLAGKTLRIKVFLAVDGFKSVMEIKNDVQAPHTTVWRVFKHLEKGGLIFKIGSKSKSPIYAKKRWAQVLHIDDYLETKYWEQITS